MYRLALAIAGNDADAADITQDSFVAVWRQLPKLREAARFDAWLHRIVVNSARMATRGQRRRRVREIADSEIAGAATPTAGSDGQRLTEALGQLSVEQRTLLALHHFEGRPIGEIAEILGVPTGTVKSRLFAARRALGAALAEGDTA